jgi:hypothetical protein
VHIDARLDVTTVVDGRWEVAVAVDARGRGPLRPVMAIVLWWARRSLRSDLLEALDALPAQVRTLEATMHGSNGQRPTADDIAAAWITDLLASVPATVPDDVVVAP